MSAFPAQAEKCSAVAPPCTCSVDAPFRPNNTMHRVSHLTAHTLSCVSKTNFCFFKSSRITSSISFRHATHSAVLPVCRSIPVAGDQIQAIAPAETMNMQITSGSTALMSTSAAFKPFLTLSILPSLASMKSFCVVKTIQVVNTHYRYRRTQLVRCSHRTCKNCILVSH